MNIGVTLLVCVICTITIFPLILFVSSCNESVCASSISKCMLTESCKCDVQNNRTCIKECSNCLNHMYVECCSCLKMCPKPNHTHPYVIHSQCGSLSSTTEMPELFESLSDPEADPEKIWSFLIYPIDIDKMWFQPKNLNSGIHKNNTYTVADGKIVIDPNRDIVTVNCTVAYVKECLRKDECYNMCSSMGASFYRWFHDGCCECVGKTCINYGIDESRCEICSFEDEDEEIDETQNRKEL